MKRGIKTKIYKAFFAVSGLSVLMSCLVWQINLKTVKLSASSSNQSIGLQAAQSSETSLIELAVDDSKNYAIAQAEIINQKLTEISRQLDTIANYVNYLHKNAEQYTPHFYSHPKDIQTKGMNMQWILAPGMELNKEIENEIYFYGNLEGIYLSTIQGNSNILGIYLTTESGINTGIDASAKTKPMYFEGRQTDWYKNAAQADKTVISDTYFDSFGRGLTITVSRPCYGADQEFIGVIALDILIEDLNSQIRFANLRNSGSVVLLSNEGDVIAAPLMEKNTEKTSATYLGSQAETILNEMRSKKTGIEQSVVDGQLVYVVYTSIKVTDWSLGIIVPVDVIIKPAKISGDVIKSIAEETEKEMEQKVKNSQTVMAIVFLIIALFVMYYSLKMSNAFTKPILKLRDSVKTIADGNLDFHLDIHTSDEIEELGNTFEAMTNELKKNMINLEKVTADKQAIATELHVATQIQTSMLPCIFPAFPERDEFEIYAQMTAAKEVGGDFYDFFMIDQNHLGIVIADVSGKGVPAALFMVIAKTLIKNHLQLNKKPAEVFWAVNNQLCENNNAGMFVTAFMGVMDIHSGNFTFVNAGHNPPLILKKGGSYEYLKSDHSFVLAGYENMEYKQEELILFPGDKMFFYTDGVTEAANEREELFGEDRLLNFLNQGKSLPVTNLLPLVQEKIRLFVGLCEQADDITLLALEYKGGERNE